MNTRLIVLAVVAIAASNLPTTFALRYSVHTTKVTFYEAWVQCSSKGGQLATPETPRQHDAIVAAIKKAGSSGEHWLAGTDLGLEGSWIWITSNAPVGIVGGYLNWAAGEPNNAGTGQHCLIVDPASQYKWFDNVCENTYNYVCEYYA